MSSIHEDKPGDKTGRKGRKADGKTSKRDRRKKDQVAATTAPDEATPVAVEMVTEDAAAPTEFFQSETAVRVPEIVEAEQQAPTAESTAVTTTPVTAAPVTAAPVTADAELPAPVATAPASSDVPAQVSNGPVSIQTIANAYGDYTRNSLQETRSYVAKLMEVRSVDKAVEVQAVFAKRAYENFVAESQKIFDLYGELARQTLNSWQACAGKATQARR